MLEKRQRLINLQYLRQDIARNLKNLLAENSLSIAELVQITSWQPMHLQAIIDSRTTLNIGELNYLASIFDRKIKIEYVSLKENPAVQRGFLKDFIFLVHPGRAERSRVPRRFRYNSYRRRLFPISYAICR